MTSQINPNNIDGTYPVAGQPNNTQGFRDNFTNIKTNFSAAATEITDLENNGVFKAALSGTTLDNNMSDNLIYAVKLNDLSYTALQQTSTAGSITLNYSSAQYQTIAPTANISLGFSNWPASGSYGELTINVVVTNTAYTMTLPVAVTLGLTGIQGYSANVITFAATGTYNFKFSTVDSGTTITIYDLNRPLNYYTNAVNVAASTASTSTTTGALIVAGGVGIGGNLYVNGDIFGNITIGDFSTGNVTASGYVSATGNILTSGLITATGNITGGNIRTAGLITATGNITAGNILNNGLTSVTGNITGGNMLTGGLVSATGTVTGSSHLGSVVSVSANVTGGNVLTGGLVSATSTVIGSSHLGAVVSVTANVTGGNILTGGLISATANITSAANITGGNILTGGLISATANITSAANITGGNILTGGLISAASTVTGTSVLGSVVSVTANITGGNILTGGLISATANITSAANITGGNILTGGLISATSTITSASSIKSSGATAGIGYATGAGGTVTQGTSRATAVTLNTVTGNIVLFTVAGNTTPTTFTLTNSAIANTDVVILNQRSGTNLYNLLVSQIGATGGNANITVWTTGGVTSEAPIINFAVIKGVAA